MSGHCATNKMLLHRKQVQSNKCPCCNDLNLVEDTHHQVHCTLTERLILWQDGTSALDVWLMNKDTHPILRQSIVAHIQGRGSITFESTIDPLYAFPQDQDDIG